MLVFVSTSEDGWIDGYRMDRNTGRLTPTSRTPVGRLVMPMTVGRDARRLYAAVRSTPATIHTYQVDWAGGCLTLLGKTPALPDNKVYLSTDRAGRFLLTASFAGNNFAIYPLDDRGCVASTPCDRVSIGGKAHCILIDRSNRFVYAINFGQGRIHQFLFDAATGKMTENNPAAYIVDPAVGPRVATLSPDNLHLYVIHQYSGDVAQFAIDQERGTLQHIGDTPSVPPHASLLPGVMHATAIEANSHGTDKDDVPRIWASDIQITPDGRFLFTTERSNSTVSILSIGSDGVRYVGYVDTERQPRGIAMDPTGHYLVVAGERSDRLSVYTIDQHEGRLTLLDRYPVGRGANWIEILADPAEG